jgi:predicted nucleotidyltransferase
VPEGVSVQVPSIPALVILKIAAWQDRKYTHPGRDAPDLLLYLRSYMDCGNLERAAEKHADLFEADDFDHAEAGVRLIARDVAALLDQSAIERLLVTLVPEADEDGPLLLAHQSAYKLGVARLLLEVFCDELGSRPSHRQRCDGR